MTSWDELIGGVERNDAARVREIEDFLHAVKTGQLEWVDRWLSRNPAFALPADEEGTALEHAERCGHTAIADRLRAVR